MKTKLQFDGAKRVVSLENLRAMCARVSGTCHRFTIDETVGTRVRVTYSNPDEYGSACPTVAHLPCWRVNDAKELEPEFFVVLDPVRYTGGRPDDESWQAFASVWDCPPLFRDADGEWRTELEILQARHPGHDIKGKWVDGGSRQVWLYQGEEFRERANAQTRALTVLRCLSKPAQQ